MDADQPFNLHGCAKAPREIEQGTFVWDVTDVDGNVVALCLSFQDALDLAALLSEKSINN